MDTHSGMEAEMFVRGFALFFSVVTLLNVVSRPFAGSDCTIWWIDLRIFPSAVAIMIELFTAGAFGVVACGYRRSDRIRRATAVMFLFLAAIATLNSIVFFTLLAGNRMDPAVPVPMTLVVAAILAFLARSAVRSSPALPATTPHAAHWLRSVVAMGSGVAVASVSLPIGQMVFFGTTDYRSAGATTAVVVLGAGVRADGMPSQALFDRVTTACRLFHEGRASMLVFSGGPGPGVTHETDAMRAIAIAGGVPDSAIVLDRRGVSTEATAENTTRILRDHDVRRTLAVSHGYHLPRVKLAFAQRGMSVYTVPAKQSRTLSATPYYMLREIPALWVYWLDGLMGI